MRCFKSIIVLVIVSLVVVSFACSQPKTLTILHTNDIHASYVPHEALWVQSDPKPMVGGFEELWWTIDSLRKAKGTTILLDGGDVMTGTPISDIDYRDASGGALFEMMNMTGYDAWTIGNHDLDISQDNLRKLTGIAKFPTVSANLVDTLGNFPLNNKEYVILKKGDVRIGVIGLMSTDLFHLTNTNNLKGLKVLPTSEVTQKIIDKILGETDLIVAVTHEGVDDDSLLAVSTHGLNVIIGGHSHTRLKTPKLINGVIICQTGSNCENLGALDLTVENHIVTKYDGKLIQLWARLNRGEAEITEFIERFQSEINAKYGEQLGTLVTDWKRSGKGETNIGDFIADAIREGANAQVAVTNSSGIRKDLHAGPILKLDLFEICPFRNYLATFSISGKELRAFAQRYAQTLVDGRSALQVSGLTCTWKRVDGKADIQSLKVGNEDINDGKQYLFATSDYTVNQADKYLGFVPSAATITDQTLYDIFVAKVKKEKTINSQIENRFQEIK